LRSIFRPRRWRVAQLTIAVIALAVPASALAFAGHGAGKGSSRTSVASAAGTDPSTVPIQVRPAQVAVGRPITITGTASGAPAGSRVTLQGRVAGRSHWRSLQATTVGSGGQFRFTAHLRHSSVVRVIARELSSSQSQDSASGGAGAASVATGTTAATPVQVTANVVAHRADRAVLADRRITVRGRVLPVAGVRRVRLQGHSAHGWQTLAGGRTRRSGRFALRYRASTGTNRMLRVLFAGDAANGRASASAGTVTVYQPALASWYYDAGLQTGCGFNARYGVANRTLPCGTKVQFRYGGRTVMATVDDRGPYVGGRTWDLGQSTRAALGFQGVGTVWASVR
jgi:rare lipoprotein A